METTVGVDLQACKVILENDGIVAIPTETVYGLAGNALSPKAIELIYVVKDRPRVNPLIIHISSANQLEQYAKNIPLAATRLMEAFWPGPLTLLLEKKDNIPSEATSGSPLAAFRVPDHPLTLQLLQSVDFPLVAPSANPFGYISPSSAQHVLDQLSGKIPYILDGGPCEKGIESTIIGFEGEKAILYRSGALDNEAISFVLGQNLEKYTPKSQAAPVTSGMMKHHYAPLTPMLLVDSLADFEIQSGVKVGIISFDTSYTVVEDQFQIVLSPSSDLLEAAKNLYSALHMMDKKNVELIIAEKVPHQGIGIAINDRLEKASNRG